MRCLPDFFRHPITMLAKGIAIQLCLLKDRIAIEVFLRYALSRLLGLEGIFPLAYHGSRHTVTDYVRSTATHV